MAERLQILIDVDVKGSNEINRLKTDLTGLGQAGKSAAPGLQGMTTATGGLSGALKGLAAGGVLVGAGKMLLDFGKASIATASDIEEMSSKFKIVFGDLTGPVTADLEKFADASNRSKYDLMGFAATLQDTLKPMGIAPDLAADLSTQLVKLGTDLSSFNNMPMDEALRRLQGTLIGSHENALAFGVVINENTLKAELAANGWDKLTGAQLESAKVQARINLLMKGTTDAQGDAIRTADSYANQTKGLQAAMTDLQATLGNALLPSMTRLVEIATDAARALEVTAGAGGKYDDSVSGMIQGNIQSAQSMQELIAAGQKLSNTLDDVGVTGVKLTGTTDAFKQGLRDTAMAIAENSESAADMRKNLEAAFGADLFRNVDEMGLSFIDLGMGVSIYVDELERASNGANRFSSDMDELRRMGSAAFVEQKDAANQYGQSLEQLAQLGRAATQEIYNGSTVAADAVFQVTNQLKDMVNQAANSQLVGALGDVDSTIGDPIRQLIEAQQQLTNSQGEWVQTTVTNANQIGAVNAQLAADLSNEQAKAYEDILKTVDEGSAEWLAAYNALQGDLTESQRQELIKRRADLEAAAGGTTSVYTGSIKDAEEAQAAIDEANQAIIESYKDLAIEGALALAELSPDPQAIERTLDYAVAIGEMTQAEADARLQAAETRIAIEALNEMVVAGDVSARTAGGAFDLLASGQANTAAQAITLAEKQQRLLDLIDKMPETAQTKIDLLMGDSIERLAAVRDLLNDIDGRNASASVNVNTATPQDLGGGSADGGKGGGGKNGNYAGGTGGWMTVPAGYPNDTYTIGLSSGEPFNVLPAGSQPPAGNSNSVSVVQHFYGSSPDTMAQARNGTMQALKEAGITGFG